MRNSPSTQESQYCKKFECLFLYLWCQHLMIIYYCSMTPLCDVGLHDCVIIFILLYLFNYRGMKKVLYVLDHPYNNYPHNLHQNYNNSSPHYRKAHSGKEAFQNDGDDFHSRNLDNPHPFYRWSCHHCSK